MATPVWLITATSSGFGKGIAKAALKKGHTVVATARDVAKIQDLKDAGAITITLDVVDELKNIKKTIDEVVHQTGRIDYVINAAGYILEGAVEEATPEETFQQFNTNVFGALNVARAALPHMRPRKSGVIAFFGSLGSWTSGPAYAHYSATKAACSSLAEGLRRELEPFGIVVTTIEPGYFRSGFLNPGAKVQTARMAVYDDSLVGQTREMLAQTDNNQPGDIEKGCQVIVDTLTRSGVAEGKKIPVRLVLGKDCVQTIRTKCNETLKLLDEWESISGSTDHVAT